MTLLLKLAFLFFMGSIFGWVLELFFRHFTSKEKKWINPGFCKGPYLPIYGFGLCILYLLSMGESYLPIDNLYLRKAVLLLIMAVMMTVIEFIGGYIFLKYSHVRLWDYSDMPGNYLGIICPQFSLIWAAGGALYNLMIHPYIIGAIEWLAGNLAFSFFIGLFFGFFIIDAIDSTGIYLKIRKWANEHQLTLYYFELKRQLLEYSPKSSFFNHFRVKEDLTSYLEQIHKKHQ